MDIEVLTAEQAGNRWLLTLQVTHDDGTTETVARQIPADIWAWRAAEYGIDPSDMDTLMDVVIYEPWIVVGREHEDHLYNTTTERAGERLLERLAAVKTPLAQTMRTAAMSTTSDATMGPDSAALDAMRAAVRVDPDQVARLAEAVEVNRSTTATANGPSEPDTPSANVGADQPQ